MREDILNILKKIRPDIDFEKESLLISEELLDSFDIISFLMEVLKTFSIEINLEEISVENFDSLDRIIRFIEKKKNKL